VSRCSSGRTNSAVTRPSIGECAVVVADGDGSSVVAGESRREVGFEAFSPCFQRSTTPLTASAVRFRAACTRLAGSGESSRTS